MKISLERTNEAFEMTASNERGDVVKLDAAATIGGGDTAWRPMQLLLAGLASCSAIDILNILYKQKQEVSTFKIEVEGSRIPDPPTTFDSISLHIQVSGNVATSKLEKAIALTQEKYCSVYHQIKDSASINYSYAIL